MSMSDKNNKNEMSAKEGTHLPDHQIKVDRQSLARLPEWMYTGKRIDGSNLTKKDVTRKGS